MLAQFLGQLKRSLLLGVPVAYTGPLTYKKRADLLSSLADAVVQRSLPLVVLAVDVYSCGGHELTHLMLGLSTRVEKGCLPVTIQMIHV
jgi:hypothetical protein